jgi:hypothetical protein
MAHCKWKVAQMPCQSFGACDEASSSSKRCSVRILQSVLKGMLGTQAARPVLNATLVSLGVPQSEAQPLVLLLFASCCALQSMPL